MINLHNAPRTATKVIFPFVRSQPICSNHLHQGSLRFNLAIITRHLRLVMVCMVKPNNKRITAFKAVSIFPQSIETM